MNHESKKLFQCDECEMLKEQGLENLAKDFASERDLKSHNSVHHSETALNTDQEIDSIKEFSSFLNTLTSDLQLLSKSQQAMNIQDLSVHEEKKLFQCDECEMLKDPDLENSAEDIVNDHLKGHKGYGAHGLRLPDKWSELIFVTYDL